MWGCGLKMCNESVIAPEILEECIICFEIVIVLCNILIQT